MAPHRGHRVGLGRQRALPRIAAALCGGLLLAASSALAAPDGAPAADAVLAAESAPAAVGDPLAGWEPGGQARRFVGQDLYGHVNGGAELFYEFGFEDLRLRGYRGPAGATLDLEIYRMADSLAALGLYLMKCGPEKPRPGLPFRHTANPYQLSAVAGRLFVQVNNFDGASDALPAMAALATRALTEERPFAADSLLGLLPDCEPLPGSLRLLHGPLALAPMITFAEDNPLELGDGRFAVACRCRGADNAIVRHIAVEYPGRVSARRAFRALNPDPARAWDIVGEDSSGFAYDNSQGRAIEVSVQRRVLRLTIR